MESYSLYLLSLAAIVSIEGYSLYLLSLAAIASLCLVLVSGLIVELVIHAFAIRHLWRCLFGSGGQSGGNCGGTPA